MSLKAYEEACARAELFGQPKPDKEDFLDKNKHLDIVEFEDVDIKNAEVSAALTEDLRAAGGHFGELNSLLASTQHKINKLKGVCGSLTTFFRAKVTAKDNLSYSSDPSYVGQGQTSLGPDDREMTGDINTAPRDLNTMERKRLMKIQVDKLDTMLVQADDAETRLSTLNKDMRGFTKR